jgi:hypothetical protein
VWKWVLQCEHQHANAVVYADGSRSSGVRGDKLRGVECVHRHQFLRAGDAIEDGDELQLQLRKWAVRVVRDEHGDAGVCSPRGSWLHAVF